MLHLEFLQTTEDHDCEEFDWSFKFKAGKYYALENGQVHRLNEIKSLTFEADVYYGIQDGNLYKLNQ